MGPRYFAEKPKFQDVILALLLPPIGTCIWYGLEKEFWVCLILTILGFIPGIVYSLYMLFRPNPDDFPVSTSSSPPSLFSQSDDDDDDSSYSVPHKATIEGTVETSQRSKPSFPPRPVDSNFNMDARKAMPCSCYLIRKCVVIGKGSEKTSGEDSEQSLGDLNVNSAV